MAISDILYQFLDEEMKREDCTNCSEGLINCEECQRTGKQECDICDGKKRLICKSCEGEGEITCTNCRGEPKVTCKTCVGLDPNCQVCSGTGRIENNCEACSNSRKIECPVEDCKNGKVACEKCDGKGKVYTIRLIENEIIHSPDKHFLGQIDKKTGSIIQIDDKLGQELLKANGFKSSGLEVLSFLWTEENEGEFELESTQKLIRDKFRHQTGINYKAGYPLLLEEKMEYGILPCFHIKYFFIFDRKNRYDLFIPLNDVGEIESLIFGKEDNFKILPSRSPLKTGFGRAFSTKKQRSIDDDFNKANLLIHIANRDNNLDLTEKLKLAEMLENSFEKFTKSSQDLLIKRIKNEDSAMQQDVRYYKFSSQERGAKAYNEILKLLKLNNKSEDLAEEIDKIKKRIKDNSPEKVTYLKNFLNEPYILALTVLMILLGILVIGWNLMF